MAHRASQSGYCRIPRYVLFDKELSAYARCVYAFLAGSVWEGRTASVGQRRISRMLGISRGCVAAGIRELALRQHIEIVALGKKRTVYILTSVIFGQKQGKVDVIRGRRLVSVDCQRHSA